jgi:Relaxase/Mobilisation nuclease domain.
MNYLRIVGESYTGNYCLDNVIGYILRDKNSGMRNSLAGGIGIVNISEAADEFRRVKKFYDKTDGKQLEHIILSPDPRQLITGLGMYIAAKMTAAMFADRFQSVFAVHTDTKIPHAHIAINTVSYKEGSRLHIDSRTFICLKEYAENNILKVLSAGM